MDHDLILFDLKNTARHAGQKILEFYDADFSGCDDDFPVTRADLAANEIIFEDLKKYQKQGVGILSEETKNDRIYLSRDKIFIVDPLDGTKDFIRKTGDFSVLIAYLEEEEIKVGVVYKPVDNIMYWAVKGRGAFKEEGGKIKRIYVSQESNLSKMKLLISRFHAREEELALKEKLGLADFEQMGSTAKMCLVAEGKAYIYVNFASQTGEWDSAAPVIIAEEAGAKVTDILGNNLKFKKSQPYNTHGFIVTNGLKHSEILKVAQGLFRDYHKTS